MKEKIATTSITLLQHIHKKETTARKLAEHHAIMIFASAWVGLTLTRRRDLIGGRNFVLWKYATYAARNMYFFNFILRVRLDHALKCLRLAFSKMADFEFAFFLCAYGLWHSLPGTYWQSKSMIIVWLMAVIVGLAYVLLSRSVRRDAAEASCSGRVQRAWAW